MPVIPLSVHALFNLLRESVEAASATFGAQHALVPLEPWVLEDGGMGEVSGTATLTGRGHLVVTAAGRQVPVLRARAYPLSGKTLSVGRTSKADLVMDQPTVSRIHAELTVSGNEVLVTDKGSYNGTMINHRVLDPHEQVQLHDGDVLVFGEAQTVFGHLKHLADLIRAPLNRPADPASPPPPRGGSRSP